MCDAGYLKSKMRTHKNNCGLFKTTAFLTASNDPAKIEFPIIINVHTENIQRETAINLSEAEYKSMANVPQNISNYSIPCNAKHTYLSPQASVRLHTHLK